MSHRAQPSTASSSFAYSSFDPSSSSSSSPHVPPPQLNDYSYGYDQPSSHSGGRGGGYEYDQFDSSPVLPHSEVEAPPLGRGKRNDSIFSFTSIANNKQRTGETGEEGGGGAFEGDEYRNHSFFSSSPNPNSGDKSTSSGRRNKRYGLSVEDTTTTAEEYELDSEGSEGDSDDLEVFDSVNPSLDRHDPITSTGPILSASKGVTGGGGAGRRNSRFERLTSQELGWMGLSAVLVTGLMTGAVVVAIVG
ncbi:uncharacterized protein JCM6883_003965 [Sporobolomyces salmoneus]|uniref:uncharacterized protein n=1 Tax=Sporobolomyces salmoneus TaxID=183962 RepID=UPI0031815C1C